MATQLTALLDRAAAAGGMGTLDSRTLARLEKWLNRLEEWNARMDLTAARSQAELVDLMLADAIAIAMRIPWQANLVDVGTGAGAPGLALALLRDDLRVTLVEPLGKRASFLRTVLGDLRRKDIAIERARGEALAGRRAWDVAISRATLSPPEWLGLGTTLVRPGGCVWVLLAKEVPPSHAHTAIDADHAYTWPLTGADRRAIVYRVEQ
jgi:16S rRNA (guanine527-N7)-methyltransferase